MPDDAAAAAAAHAELYGSYAQRLARSRGGPTGRVNELVLADGGFSSEFRNVVVAARPLQPATVAGLRDRGQDFFGRSDRWTVWTYAGEDLHEHGFAPSGDPCVVMIRDDPSPPAASANVGLEVREVRVDAEVRLFEQIREHANGRPFDASGATYLDGRCIGEGHRMWLGRHCGLPVAAAAAFSAGEHHLLMNVSVVPNAQRAGFGTIMSVHPMTSGGRWVLHSRNPAAIALYRRLGFDERARLQIWEPT